MLGVRKLAPGMLVDGYRIEAHLHSGGMAALWKVTRDDLPEPAVMKTPALSDPSDPTGIVSFEVEQMIMPVLTGPHVPRYLGAGGFEEQPYIVMEMLHGDSLRARFDQAPLPLDEVARIGSLVATALHALHHQRVIHFDIKPSNVMFRRGPDGEPAQAVLIDFGLARHERLPDLLAEEFRVPMGTGPYISPEQVLRQRTDPRSDLFSLGVLLYHLATGQRPFGFPSTVSGLRKRLWQLPVPPRKLRPEIAPWLQEVILRCLEVDPEERYGSAAQLAFDLAHPDEVQLTDRADRTKGNGWLDGFRKRLRAMTPEEAAQSVSTQLARAPIIMAAIDVTQEHEALADAVRAMVRQAMQALPNARVACVTVLRTNRIGMDQTTDSDGRNLHVRRLIELQHWARPLGLPPGRATFHVLESPDLADALLQYATDNRVDQIVIGSRGPSALKRYLGAVSTAVVSRAECTVTVVRVN
ncbi:serine/threonine protein kinase [Derxia gummosa]|uniref:Serine/threonine protein kinase n=1 Tax=Derxia gummosa DSM 723 TaxID=1121388 RepID=A0A8B6X6W7_9BURK|nr:bifunctional serine/threonine-protein kinase/universal stress protein [Derxia gummosa]